jgi:hypothetical protein
MCMDFKQLASTSSLAMSCLPYCLCTWEDVEGSHWCGALNAYMCPTETSVGTRLVARMNLQKHDDFLYLYQGWFVHTKTNQLALIRWLNWILIFWQLRWFQMEYIETSSCSCWLCCLQAKASREAPHMNYFIDILAVHGMCCCRSPSMSGSVITLAVFYRRAYAIICTTFFSYLVHEGPSRMTYGCIN